MHGYDWIKIAEIMNRPKISVYKQYISVTRSMKNKENKEDKNDYQRYLAKPGNLDENRLRRWKCIIKYRINSNILKQCRNSCMQID